MSNIFEKFLGKKKSKEPQPDKWADLKTVKFTGETEPLQTTQKPESYHDAPLEPDRHQRKIIAHFLDNRNPEHIRARDVSLNQGDIERFYQQILDGTISERDQADFLSRIGAGSSPEDTNAKIQEYAAALSDLKAAADNWQKTQPKHQESVTTLANINEERQGSTTGEKYKYPLIKDFDYFEMSRAQARNGMYVGREDERLPQDYTEDAHLEMPEQGLFAVFDGAGGINNVNGAAAIASQTAARAVYDSANKFDLNSAADLAWALNEASATIEATTNAGVTTAAVAKVIQSDGQKYLAYANAGDSRIYVVHRTEDDAVSATQITRDEGVGHRISNALGYLPRHTPSDSRTQQFGTYPIQPGDRIVLCTDGITGDTPEESLHDHVIASTVALAWSPAQAARGLADIAKKKDDRTAIVFQV